MSALDFLRDHPDCDITRVLPVVRPDLMPADIDEPDCGLCGGTGEVTAVDTGGYARFGECPECGWV